MTFSASVFARTCLQDLFLVTKLHWQVEEILMGVEFSFKQGRGKREVQTDLQVAQEFALAFSSISVKTGRFKQRGHDKRHGGTSCHNSS